MTIETFIIEAIGVLGFLTNVWANILLARKHESGWLIRLVANALWLVFSIAAMSFANLLSSGVFAVINIYGWRRWRRERLALAHKPLCAYCDFPGIISSDKANR
jgi:nicotinamide riboside transporter PnuC